MRDFECFEEQLQRGDRDIILYNHNRACTVMRPPPRSEPPMRNATTTTTTATTATTATTPRNTRAEFDSLCRTLAAELREPPKPLHLFGCPLRALLEPSAGLLEHVVPWRMGAEGTAQLTVRPVQLPRRRR